MKDLGNLASEAGLLSACLLNPGLLDELRVGPPPLAPQHFYAKANEALFEALCALSDQHRTVDLVTLAEYLQEQGALERVGGYVRLSQLFDVVVDPKRAPEHARIIHTYHQRRTLRQIGAALSEGVLDLGTPVASCLNQALDGLYALASGTHQHGQQTLSQSLAQATRHILEAQTAAAQGHPIGLQSGIHGLDHLTGGFQREELSILAARPAVGKSSLALQIAATTAHAGKRVLYFSLEMSARSLALRLMALATRIPAQRFQRGQVGPPEVKQAIDRLQHLDLTIFDTQMVGQADFQTQARLAARTGSPDLIIIDYLQLIPSRATRRDVRRDEELGLITKTLRHIARSHNCHVLALAQLNRDVEKRAAGSRPQLADLRESGALEQDADWVMFLHPVPPPAAPHPGKPAPAHLNDMRPYAEVDLILAKHRNGPTGDVRLHFYKQFGQWVGDKPFTPKAEQLVVV